MLCIAVVLSIILASATVFLGMPQLAAELLAGSIASLIMFGGLYYLKDDGTEE